MDLGPLEERMIWKKENKEFRYTSIQGYHPIWLYIIAKVNVNS